MKANVSELARPRLSKYSTGRLYAPVVEPASVASAGRLMPRSILEVGVAVNCDVAIFTGSRFTPLLRLTLPMSPDELAGQPRRNRPLWVRRFPFWSGKNEPVGRSFSSRSEGVAFRPLSVVTGNRPRPATAISVALPVSISEPVAAMSLNVLTRTPPAAYADERCCKTMLENSTWLRL